VTKSCPPTAPPNSTVTCTFTVQNLDATASVTSLSVTNKVPLPRGSAVAVQCKQGGVQVFALGPNGGATDTCTGSVDESTPACAATSTNFADRVSASGSDTGQFVFGFAEQTVVIPACTPTPTNTPTNTPTRTPTPTPTPTRTQTPAT